MNEFVCEGCAIQVTSFGSPPSDHLQFCAVCAFLSEFEPPETIMETRRKLEPGGWWTERGQRSYRNDSYPERSCDYCGKSYKGAAVYCSLGCALSDA